MDASAVSPSRALPRALRSDAVRNREAILCAAAEAYAERGIDVSLEEVARQASVGVGTIYRRFPTKQALIEALFEGRMARYADHAEAAAELALTEPWRAFAEHVRFLVAEQIADRTFSEVVRNPSSGPDSFRAEHRRALRGSLTLVKHAQRAGVLAAGFRHSDLLLVGDAVHGVLTTGRPDNADQARRLAEYLLQSFRHPAGGSRVAPAPAQVPAQVPAPVDARED